MHTSHTLEGAFTRYLAKTIIHFLLIGPLKRRIDRAKEVTVIEKGQRKHAKEVTGQVIEKGQRTDNEYVAKSSLPPYRRTQERKTGQTWLYQVIPLRVYPYIL